MGPSKSRASLRHCRSHPNLSALAQKFRYGFFDRIHMIYKILLLYLMNLVNPVQKGFSPNLPRELLSISNPQNAAQGVERFAKRRPVALFQALPGLLVELPCLAVGFGWGL